MLKWLLSYSDFIMPSALSSNPVCPCGYYLKKKMQIIPDFRASISAHVTGRLSPLPIWQLQWAGLRNLH